MCDPSQLSLLSRERRAFHDILCEELFWRTTEGVPTNADKSSKASKAIADALLDNINPDSRPRAKLKGQSQGNIFETLCLNYLKSTFLRLSHLRPGNWVISRGGQITDYEQYSHLIAPDEAAIQNKKLAEAFAADYTISPDIVIYRNGDADSSINAREILVDDFTATRTALRESVATKPLLHANISCKWTIRSDRAQNCRTEALNLIRSRKGPVPHIVVVSGEPTPSRLASLALGTGDIDCVYHIALDELQQAVDQFASSKAKALFSVMVDGKRLKDISDLPLDLAV